MSTAKKASTKSEAEDLVNPKSFFVMMLSGAVAYALKHWDEYRAEVAESNGHEVDADQDDLWNDSRDALSELVDLLQAFSILTADPTRGEALGNMLVKAMIAHV